MGAEGARAIALISQASGQSELYRNRYGLLFYFVV